MTRLEQCSRVCRIAIVVEATPRLLSMMSCRHQPLQQRRRCESLLAELFEHDVGDVESRLQADEIEQGKWSHRVTASKLHALVDVFDTSGALLERANGIEQIRHEQSIHYESGSIGSANGNLAETHCKLHRFVHDGRCRHYRGHHFHQLHQGHRIEEMDADKTVDRKSTRLN